MEQKLPKLDEMSKSPEETEPEAARSSVSEPYMEAGKISIEIEHFSRLSSDLMKCLSSLLQKVQNSLEQLHEDHRIRKERFESLMESQRKRWEEEKARSVKEDKEYLENLKIQRQCEEDQYRQKWDAEQQEARQKLDEELQALRQENRLKLETLENDCLQRELILKEKELECTRFIQELEQFMSRLAGQARSRAVPSPISPASDNARKES